MLFADLPLKPEIIRALNAMGYKELTPVQKKTFNHILEGRDIMAMAETGSGKTSACGIPLVQNTDPACNEIQGLILVPTRELALQYVSEIDLLCRYNNISPFAIYGGFSMGIQKAKLTAGVHILVATPGRLIDHLYNSDLTLSHVKTVVLDEADEMLDMGFIDDVKFIMSCIIGKHQTLLFSATMPADIEKLASEWLTDPEKISLNLEQVAPPSITHNFIHIRHPQRLSALKKILQKDSPGQAIIFCNSKKNSETLHRKLKEELPSVEHIHGGMDQSKRTSVFNRFKKHRIDVLIATDVAGRGLDFSHVTHVINYDFPNSIEIYTHRTGRTGRMGRTGIAISLVTDRDLPTVKRLLKENRISPVWMGDVPDLNRIRKSKPAHRNFRRKSGHAPERGASRSKSSFTKKGHTKTKATSRP